MRVTMKDIAKEAGVSVATVERALNDRDGISKKTKQKVHDIAKELGYKANPIGKALALQRNPVTIGVAINDPEVSHFAREVRRGVEAAGDEVYDFGIRIKHYAMNPKSMEQQLQVFEAMEADEVSAAVVKANDEQPIAEKMRRLNRNKIPIVNCSSDVMGSDRLCVVGQNQEKEGRIAASLINKTIPERAKILILNGAPGILGQQRKMKSFLDHLKQLNSTAEICEIINPHDYKDEIGEMILEIVEKHKEIHAICILALGKNEIERIINKIDMNPKPRICVFGDVNEKRGLLEKGVVDFIINANPYEHGYKSIKVLTDYFLYNTTPKSDFIEVETEIIIDESFS